MFHVAELAVAEFLGREYVDTRRGIDLCKHLDGADQAVVREQAEGDEVFDVVFTGEADKSLMKCEKLRSARLIRSWVPSSVK